MEKNFEDIFESIKLLHKKYNSEDYLNNLDNFNKSSKDLEEILEKYNTDEEKGHKKRRHRLNTKGEWWQFYNIWKRSCMSFFFLA